METYRILDWCLTAKISCELAPSLNPGYLMFLWLFVQANRLGFHCTAMVVSGLHCLKSFSIKCETKRHPLPKNLEVIETSNAIQTSLNNLGCLLLCIRSTTTKLEEEMLIEARSAPKSHQGVRETMYVPIRSRQIRPYAGPARSFLSSCTSYRMQ